MIAELKMNILNVSSCCAARLFFQKCIAIHIPPAQLPDLNTVHLSHYHQPEEQKLIPCCFKLHLSDYSDNISFHMFYILIICLPVRPACHIFCNFFLLSFFFSFLIKMSVFSCEFPVFLKKASLTMKFCFYVGFFFNLQIRF